MKAIIKWYYTLAENHTESSGEAFQEKLEHSYAGTFDFSGDSKAIENALRLFPDKEITNPAAVSDFLFNVGQEFRLISDSSPEVQEFTTVVERGYNALDLNTHLQSTWQCRFRTGAKLETRLEWKTEYPGKGNS